MTELKLQSKLSTMQTLTAITLIAGCLVLFALGGVGVVAGEEAPQTVDVETPDPMVEGDGQTIDVTVENTEDERIEFPLVEVPLDDITITEDDQFDREDGTSGVEGVAVTLEGDTENRLAFIDESSIQGDTDALYIEGESIPANTEKTYEFNVEVDTTNQADITVDVRPLNDEGANTRVNEQVDLVGPLTIESSVDGGSNVTINGTLFEDDEPSKDLPSNQDYDVSTDISALNKSVSVEVTGGDYETVSAEFTNVESGDAQDPTVVAQTGSTADIIGESTSLVRGDAETNTTQDIEFDMVISSGETRVIVESDAGYPIGSIEQTNGVDNDELVTVDDESAALLEFDGAIDETVTVELDGYPVGDVSLDGEVTDEDAQMIASAIASGESASLYGDVTDSGDITAVDAMKIQQYDDGNRDAAYNLNGGN